MQVEKRWRDRWSWEGERVAGLGLVRGLRMCQRGGIVVERDCVGGVIFMRSWSIFFAAVRPKRVIVVVEELLLLLLMLLLLLFGSTHAMEQMVPIKFLVTRALLFLLFVGKSDRERISINCNIVWHVTFERT